MISSRGKTPQIVDDSHSDPQEIARMLGLVLKGVAHNSSARASELLEHYGSLRSLFVASINTSFTSSIITDSELSVLRSVHKLMIHVLQEKLRALPVVNSIQDLKRYLGALMTFDPKESTRILYLDLHNRMLADELHSIGTHNFSPIFPREIARRAIYLNSSAVIIVHNHPSGNATPSEEDINATRSMSAILGLLEISVIDHFIVGAGEVFSMRSHGFIGSKNY